MEKKLQGKKIAILATCGFEQSELEKPYESFKDAGAEVEILSIDSGEIQGYQKSKEGKSFKVDRLVKEARVGDYDGLVLPGGVANPDALRMDKTAVKFIKDFFSEGRPIAAICHGPWTLVEAGVVKDRTLTSWPSLKTDIENAGGKWVDEEVHCDQGLVTSRKPDDLNAFCAKAIEEFREGKHFRKAS